MGKLATSGKPTVQFRKIATPESELSTMPMSVGNTVKLTTIKGNKLEAKVEGSDSYYVRYSNNTYQFEFELYYGECVNKPIEEVNGVVVDNYQFRIIPENPFTSSIAINKGGCGLPN